MNLIKRHQPLFTVILCFLGLIFVPETFPASDSPLGEKVVAFCVANLNQKVGGGQCAELAGQALKSAGAKIRTGPDFPNEHDYVWGKQVYMAEGSPEGLKETGSLANVRPGDIVQYRSTKWGETGHFEHHTSVVYEIDEAKKILGVYQQNIGGKQFVMEGHPKLNKLVGGWLRIYRPQKN